jgi:hypothetical protein
MGFCAPATFRHGPPVLLPLVVLWMACGGGGRVEPPGPGSSTGTPPDLRGVRVMLLPTQSVRGIATDPDPEIRFAVSQRGSQVLWSYPDDLRRALARSPGMGVDIDALAVGGFLRAEVRRVGDPLFGDLRRLAALTDARAALIPVEVRRAGGEGDQAVEIAAALIHVDTGRVLWFGVVEGRPGAADDPGSLASAAETLARTLVR